MARNDASLRLTAAIAVGLVLTLLLHGPIAQWAEYHAFADRRHWLGLPNALDVLSNLPFAFVGAWGLVALARVQKSLPARRSWQVFCAALMCTAIGSAWYHLAPDNARLVTDRLPIAWAFAALCCAFGAERIDRRLGGALALSTALGAASGSVALWWWGDRYGAGDLRAYLFVQFFPMLLVPVTLWLKRDVSPTLSVPSLTWWSVLALYALAKVFEVADHAIYAALGSISGHTLKHLTAAAAAACLAAAFSRHLGASTCGR
jgi:hypothetical protein